MYVPIKYNLDIHIQEYNVQCRAVLWLTWQSSAGKVLVPSDIVDGFVLGRASIASLHISYIYMEYWLNPTESTGSVLKCGEGPIHFWFD